jgi:Ca2+/H+ antiporter
MLLSVIRVVLGFAVACFAAAVTMVLFVLTPSEIVSLPPDVASDRIGRGMQLAQAVAVQVALFSAPFFIVAAGLGEALRNRNWTYYVVAALVIAGFAFFAQLSTERTGQSTILNNYALIAFLTSGFVSGLCYWMVSGRRAGGRRVDGSDTSSRRVHPRSAPTPSAVDVSEAPDGQKA